MAEMRQWTTAFPTEREAKTALLDLLLKYRRGEIRKVPNGSLDWPILQINPLLDSPDNWKESWASVDSDEKFQKSLDRAVNETHRQLMIEGQWGDPMTFHLESLRWRQYYEPKFPIHIPLLDNPEVYAVFFDPDTERKFRLVTTYVYDEEGQV